MEYIFLFVFLSLCCFERSTPATYYITPDHDCIVNGTTLSPCLMLQQLNNEVFSTKSVELLLLSGTHQLEQTLSMSDLSEVIIQPLDEELELLIQCHFGADLAFYDVLELNMYSLNFVHCSLHTNSKVDSSFNITKCIFERSLDYAFRITVSESELSMVVSNCKFLFNNGSVIASASADDGCSPAVVNVLIADTLFQSNFNSRGTNFYGSALICGNAFLIVRNSQFVNNTASSAIYAQSSQLLLGNTQFYESPLYLSDSSLNISNCLFMNNPGPSSALYMTGKHENFRSFISGSVFQGNRAGSGAALYVHDAGLIHINDCHFENNSAQNGGAFYATAMSQGIYIDNSTFIFNEAGKDGGAMYCDYGSLFQVRNGSAMSNFAKNGNGGFAYMYNSAFVVSDHKYMISNGIAQNGGAIYAVSKSSIGIGNAIVVNNTASGCGGALYLANSSAHLTGFDSDTIIEHNVAGDKGGAIFIAQEKCEEFRYPSQCFFTDWAAIRKVIFTNNSASQGPILYGGLLDRCYTDNFHYTGKKLGIEYIKAISEYDLTPLTITSDPVRVCLCTENHILDCTTRNLTLPKMRGQTIKLSGVVVDQNSTPKTSFIRAGYQELSAKFGEGEIIKETDTNCSELSYHIFTGNATAATLVLQPGGYCERSDFSSIKVHITVKPCLRGFEYYEDRCVCDRRLTNLSTTIVCDIDADSIENVGSVWLGFDGEYLRVHANCPLDYCRDNIPDTISLAYPDEQCANDRSGVLCGDCRDNHGIALGGSKCLQCTSNYTPIFLIPVFAVAGLALVALLLVCNMTISHGTLNGLIFYANVVSITGLTSLRNCSIHPILSVFIAWLNLDFGIETCFYPGMDTYQKTWLQFSFPLYIWLLVGAVILACHYSATATKVFGRNNIAVLATLFILSYAKILKTIMTALNFTYVFQGSADDVNDSLVPYKVWTSNGNVEYMKGNHVPLFVVALMFLVFLFLPYTVLLTFGQCIRSMPTQRRCVLWWIRSTAFISIMDAYHAPYNKKHHYWTGLMLLARCVLFLVFAFSYSDHQLTANMYITTIILTGILALKVFTTKVYKNSHMNMLENCFLLNLVVLSATVTYLRGTDGTICKCTSASTSVIVVTFVGILTYHAYLQLSKTRCFASITGAFFARLPNRHVIPPAAAENMPLLHALPTSTTVDLREELLESEKKGL